MSQGMTLRDYFAAKEMQAWILHCGDGYLKGEYDGNSLGEDTVAESAYKFADAMLEQREKKD